MNYIWSIIIIISLVFSLVTGNVDRVINDLFNVPSDVINTLIKIGSVLIIYSGLFKIAIESNLIDKISFLFKGFVEKTFKYERNSYINKLISSSIIANMLGLGAANTAISLKVIEYIKKDKGENASKELAMYLLINISSFTILPLSLLSIRQTYNASIVFIFLPVLIVISFITTCFSLLLVKVFYK